MTLKNAAAVCLISLFAATLVVLIARTLDTQATARLEPQLDTLIEEVRALRRQGGPVGTTGGAAASDAATSDGLVVYYFHGNTRCASCQAIESQARRLVHGEFASELARGALAWKVLNYERPAGLALAKRFEVDKASVVLVKVQDGQPRDGWRRLDELWGLVGDEAAFAALVRENLRRMLPAPAAAEGASLSKPEKTDKATSPTTPTKPAPPSATKPDEELPVP